ncbi:acyl-CoA dehydrogenase family protein [Pararhodobacter zhoushanensis]|uniref:acyl-CoA dehydrogenase family protein n=1 Tax=Pararhodobacter zhoushanensis TaxID=2479545 RepID=UPI001C7073B6|nr:acyl-CoA dehydrogenase family protein [Pararhodobacter zhoushanensis]
MTYRHDASAMMAALTVTPNWARVRGPIDDETLESILTEAAKMAEGAIAPLDIPADREGAVFDAGSVRVPAVYHPAFDALVEGGWLGLEQPEDFGGMGMPLTMFAAANPLFERACPAFMMAVGGTRSAALLLAEWAEPSLRDDWVPALVAGERCATICISEPGAGSDVGRIRTKAVKDADGWSVSGQKIWISFGDHDIRERIGHCLLARTGDAPGTRGLSLFLVERGPGVTCERLEEKMGLHGSPTCALQFDGARARLIGEEGRGLPQLFTMIRHMRLTVACQGLGTALKCYDVAATHAADRRQGGNPKEPPVAIIEHPDVRRQLIAMKSAIDIYRLALLEAATAADLSAEDEDLARFTAWMLPLVKNFGAELSFDTAGKAIMVLGGAGFTKDYTLEQSLRDSRVFAIYEGTTGMQGQDFFLRQTLGDGGKALQSFLTRARVECADHPAQAAVIEQFAAFMDDAMAEPDRSRQAWMADSVLRAGWVAVQAWLSTRIADTPEAKHFMASASAQLAMHIATAQAPVA